MSRFPAPSPSHRPAALRTALTILGATALLAACVGTPGTGGGVTPIPSEPGGSPSPTIPAVELPGDPDTLVIRVSATGGFVTPVMRATQLPQLSVYADGRIIQQGPMPAIYPSPFPVLLVSRISAAQLQALLAAADTAGLRSGVDASYPPHGIADVPDTVFTIWGPSGVTTTSFGAFGMDQSGEVPAVEVKARRGATDFMTALQSPELSAQAEPYVPTAILVYPFDEIADPSLPQEPVEWPLALRPSSTSNGSIPYACLLVTGSDLQTLWPLLLKANQLTPFVIDGKRYALGIRQLLPDEAPACPSDGQ